MEKVDQLNKKEHIHLLKFISLYNSFKTISKAFMYTVKNVLIKSTKESNKNGILEYLNKIFGFYNNHKFYSV